RSLFDPSARCAGRLDRYISANLCARFWRDGRRSRYVPGISAKEIRPMFISPAYAQAAGAAAPNPLLQLAPFILVFVFFYFLIIRPQQQARKKHMEMISNVRKGDVVVTSGGL